MFRVSNTVVIGLPFLLLHAIPAVAQVCDPGQLDCSGRILQQSMSQSALRNARMINAIVRDRLAPGGATPDRQILQYAPEVEAEDPASRAIQGESVSLATNGAALNWNAWLDGNYVYTDRDHPVSGYDGPMFALSLGIDRAIGEASVIGLLVNYEHADFDTAFIGGTGKLQSDGFGVGIYAGSAITDNIVADAMLIWSRADNDVVESLGAGSFDSDRIQAAANLTGYWYRDAWRYSPTVGITWSREKQDSFFRIPPMGAPIPTPGATLESGVAIAGFQIGHTTFIDDVRTIEPWIGINAEWEFYTSGVSSVGVSGLQLEPFDLRVLGGLNAQLSETVSGNIRADIAGLARSDYLVGTVGGQIAIRF